MNIVLLEPEIPQNTGNIARTCAVTGSSLHLIKPLGFSIDDKYLKRAGMDYWDSVNVKLYDSFNEFMSLHSGDQIYLATTKAKQLYTDVCYGDDPFFVFGKESAGIPEEILIQYPEQAIRIPMRSELRSLNLSNAASIVLYEALRQRNFPGLSKQGDLHRLSWS